MREIQNAEKNKRGRKILLIILCCVLALVAAVVIAVTVLVNNYLNRIEYDDQNQAETSEQTVSDEEILKELMEEEPDTGEADSDAEEIKELEAQMAQNSVAEEEVPSDDLIQILLIGGDSRNKGGAGRSDAMILLSVNEKTEKIHMTSIMRDCYVTIPGKGNNRINAAYAFGGGSLLLDTINANFAADVDKYVAFDFYAFVEIVDSLGGLDIEVTEAEIPILNSYVDELNYLNDRPFGTYHITQSGMQHLNGTQVLGYSRIRYVGNGDFARTQRQRLVIEKLFEKAKSMNLLELNDLLNVMLPKIKTNLTEGEILSLGLKAVNYLGYDMESHRLPIDGSYQNMQINGMSVLGIDLKANQDALDKFLAEE